MPHNTAEVNDAADAYFRDLKDSQARAHECFLERIEAQQEERRTAMIELLQLYTCCLGCGAVFSEEQAAEHVDALGAESSYTDIDLVLHGIGNMCFYHRDQAQKND